MRNGRLPPRQAFIMKQSVAPNPAQTAKAASSRAQEVATPAGPLAQLAATMNGSPRVQHLAQLTEDAERGPRVGSLRKLAEEVNGTATAQREEVHAPPPNHTGLPDQLKSGVESLSGMSLDNVRVHYNSARPAQLNALAYAQGTEIHVAPGQEKHLPHEAWHVVQQAQGRVEPTTQMKRGEAVNDDQGLEHEADVMGAKAAAMPSSPQKQDQERPAEAAGSQSATAEAPVQRVIVRGDNKGEYIDDATEIDYAFVAQSSNGKALIFASRNELAALRTQIFAEDELPVNSKDYSSVRGALNTWIKFGKESPSRKVQEALDKVTFVLVEEDKETPGTYGEFGEYLLQHLLGVLGGADDTWGHLTYKKPGFGDRAPIARGKVYLNQDKAASKEGVAAFLGVEEKDAKAGGRFGNVEYESLADAQYKSALSGAATNAIFVPEQKEDFFYVSTATREARTTSDTEGNYVLSKTKFEKTSAIPKNNQGINDSFKRLTTPRGTQDWEKVSKVGMRSGTQDQAMEGWNALGMAAYANQVLDRDLKLSQDYEWLHIRGVQNGGRNQVHNLGTGTWIANSQMIPFENQIRNWADKRPGEIQARYETTTNPKDSPVLDTITIKVAASDDHEIGPITKADPLKVVFNAQSGLLADSFSNKLHMRKFGDDADQKPYEQGVIAAQKNQRPLHNEAHARGHRHYLAGITKAKTNQAAANDGEGAGHRDYLAGITKAQANTAAANQGELDGRTDYIAGVNKAKTNVLPLNHGEGVGQTDYLAGITKAQANQPAVHEGEIAGRIDYLAGVTKAQTNQLPAPNRGEGDGHTDYLTGITRAQTNQLPLNHGQTDGHTDYLAGIAKAKIPQAPANRGETNGHTDWNTGYSFGERNAPYFTVIHGEIVGYQDGLQRFNQKRARTRKNDGDGGGGKERRVSAM